ncbi:MAG: hypothetical protein ACTSXP_00080 [Promethearchaeota archaeon]
MENKENGTGLFELEFSEDINIGTGIKIEEEEDFFLTHASPFGEQSSIEGTGIVPRREEKFVDYSFDKYVVTVRLSHNNKFLGISAIKINQDFRKLKQKILASSRIDIEEFLEEE